MTKDFSKRGKLSLRGYFQKLNIGDKVALKAEPSIQKGLYHTRFHGKICTVKGTAGASYRVLLKDGGKEKILIVHPVHLKKIN
jgi:large subunit ribosomal protein L21e